MALLHGVDRGTDGIVNMTASGTIVYQQAIPLLANGDLRTTIIAGAPGAGSKTINGISYASDGTLHVTTDAIGKVVNGVAFTANDVVCHTTNAVANSSTRAYLHGIGSVLVDTTGRVHVA